MNIPQEKDWEYAYDDFDARSAIKNFLGKDCLEAQHIIKENPVMRCFDIGYMPTIPFRYYLLSLKDLIDSGDYDPSWSAELASAFMILIEDKLLSNSFYICPIWNDLEPLVKKISSQQLIFDMDIDIYGDLKGKYSDLSKFVES